MTINYELKKNLKKVFFLLFPHPYKYSQGNKPNIFIYSSRRSGSTFLTEIIAQEPGMLAVHHPDGLHDKSNKIQELTKRKNLPKLTDNQFITLQDKQYDKVKAFFNGILGGEYPELSRPTFHHKNRVIMKLTDSQPMLDIFSNEFAPLSIHLIRHPVSQALSVVNNKWSITASAYLTDKDFVGNYLSVKQKNKAQQIIAEGSYLEKAVLNWILENLFPLKYAKKVDLRVTYEELVLQPQIAISTLASKLDLTNLSGMKKRISKPSNSRIYSFRETNKAIKDENKQYLINRWEEKVSLKDKSLIEAILKVFEISEYSAYSIFPSEFQLIDRIQL